jgi:hypothetical protein
MRDGWDMWHIWGRREMHTGFSQGNQATIQGYRMPSRIIPSPDVPPPLPFNSKKQIFNYLSLVQGNNHTTAIAAAVATVTTTTTTQQIPLPPPPPPPPPQDSTAQKTSFLRICN